MTSSFPATPTRSGGPSGSKGLAAGLHEMNLEPEDDTEDDEDEPYDNYDDQDDSLNAIQRGGPSRGGRGGRSGRGGRGAGKTTGRGAGGRSLTPQQLEWYRNHKCIQCGQEGHFKRDCPAKPPATTTGG
jgi:hypothetical protein